ncbi:hypothetical protein ACFLV6_02250 [Chloroflexota bacterium]
MSDVPFTASHQRRQEVTGKTGFRFEIGHIACTERVLQMMDGNKIFDDFVWGSFSKHCLCDWGELSVDDKKLSDENLEKDGLLYSEHKHPEYGELGIMTEEDRSRTVIAFVDEFNE